MKTPTMHPVLVVALLGSAVLVAGCTLPSLSPEGSKPKGPHILATADPSVIFPGESTTITAVFHNDGLKPFTHPDCPTQSGDDHGQEWGYGLVLPSGRQGESVNLGARCPDLGATGQQVIPPGGTRTWRHRVSADDREPAGVYLFRVSFHGVNATARFTVSAGEGTGAPTLSMVANRTHIRPGETVGIQAVIANPTQLYFQFPGWFPCSVPYEVTNETGHVIVDHRPYWHCPPSPLEYLAPGRVINQTFFWDGKRYFERLDEQNPDPGTPDYGLHTITFQFDYTNPSEGPKTLRASAPVVVEDEEHPYMG